MTHGEASPEPRQAVDRTPLVLLAAVVLLISSLAFILVSEGPTTIIPYSSGYFSIKDMARAGVWMTVIAAGCVAVAVALNAWLRL